MMSRAMSQAFLLTLVSISLIPALLGCNPGGRYVETSEVSPVSEFFSDTDFKILVSGIASSLRDGLTALPGRTLMFYPIANRTSDRIDMVALTDSIATEISSGGGFNIVNFALREEIRGNLSAYEDIVAQREYGREIGADYIVTGRLSLILSQTDKNEQMRSYMLTVYATDAATGVIVTAVERRMKKAVGRSRFVI